MTRRYLCKVCGAIMVVAPRGVVRRRLYGATAIGLALVLLGIEGGSAGTVRAAVSPTASRRSPAEGAGWTTLRRWAGEAHAGTLIEDVGACPATFSLRQAAERVASSLMALGERAVGVVERVWEGALRVRWRGAS